VIQLAVGVKPVLIFIECSPGVAFLKIGFISLSRKRRDATLQASNVSIIYKSNVALLLRECFGIN
jgi:hypothetical protein